MNIYIDVLAQITLLYWGKRMTTEKEIVASGKETLEIAEVLNATNLKILRLIQKEPLYITTISKKLGLSEGYISNSVRDLEDLKLLSTTYQRGNRGIRKICLSNLKKITLILKDEELQTSNSTKKMILESIET